MVRNTRFALLFLLLTYGVAQMACAFDSGSRVPVSGETAPTVSLVPATPTEQVGTETAADAIVGVWTAIDGALHLQFFSDGTFVRHYGGREDAPDELWSQEGAYQFTSHEHLLIEVTGVETTGFEYQLEEPWLLLRDEDGKVMRFRRNLGFMDTY